MLDRTVDLRRVWTEEMDAKLRSMVGVSSFRQIAAILDVSRNAAIGRADRIGLSNKKPKLTPEQIFVRDAERELCRLRTNERRNQRRRERRANGTFAPIPFVRRVTNAPRPEPLNLSLMDLEANQCRWADSADAPFLFCGATRDGHPSYCPHHHQLSIAAEQPFKKRRAA